MKTFNSKSRILVLTFLAMPFLSIAQDGSLDMTFGTGGLVKTFVGAKSADMGTSVAIQSDGKIVVAGNSNNGTNKDFALVRYKTNGSLDSSFDGDGMVTTAFGLNNEDVQCVGIQADGKIIAAGNIYNGSTYSFALARYHTNGSLDLSFGTAGKVITAIGRTNASINAIAIQSDGKIVVGGTNTVGDDIYFALARYKIDGSLDSTFDTDGIVTTGFETGVGVDVCADIAIQPDGKIIAAGSTVVRTQDFGLVRYNTDGSLDNSFGTRGKVSTDFMSDADGIRKIALQADGKIVATGVSNNGSNADFAVARYNTDGSLDRTFGTDGKVITNIGSTELAYTSVLQSDGKIIAAGVKTNAAGLFEFLLVRYKNSGSLDSTFGTYAIVTTGFGLTSDYGISIALQADGKIVLAGFSSKGFTTSFSVARYNNSIPTSINALGTANNEISLYPNPTQDILHIQGAAIGSTIALYDMQGRMLKREVIKVNDASISMQELAKGNYLIKITTKEGVEGSAKVLKE